MSRFQSIVRIAPSSAIDGSTFIGAIGFEGRVNHLLASAVADGAKPKLVTILDLQTFAVPAHLDMDARWESQQAYRQAAEKASCAMKMHFNVDPYAWFSLVVLFRRFLADHQKLFIDISGFTRLMVTALASVLGERASSVSEGNQVSIGYTRPLTYRHSPSKVSPAISYQDTLIAPLRDDLILRRTGFSRGVFLLGHEGARARTMFREHPAAAGVVLVPSRVSGGSLEETCRRNNSSLLRELRSSRMPDASSSNLERERDGWLQMTLSADAGYGAIAPYVKAEAEVAAQDGDAPLMLYLLGPKLGCLFTSLAAVEAGAAAWTVYSVPSHYDATSADGIDGSISYQIFGPASSSPLTSEGAAVLDRIRGLHGKSP